MTDAAMFHPHCDVNDRWRLLGDLAIELQHQADPQDTLRAIVEGALDLVLGARWAGISLIQTKTVVPQVPSDPLVAELDDLQSTLDEGPGFSALREQHIAVIDDTATDTRWPRFARAAHARGVHSLMSVPLFVRGENLGALNLYGDRREAFTEESKLVGTVLAQHASIAMVGAAAQTQFATALASRDVIGQAKGILMYREKISAAQAFALLRKSSQNANLKVVDIARWIVEQHDSQLSSP